jgi:hypothetical protein
VTIAVDTSVAVAAFAPWHESHRIALEAVRDTRLPAHCGIETYSTLTRLPAPLRAPPAVVAEYLGRRFEGRWIFPGVASMIGLPTTLAALGIAGGAGYDALVAITVMDNDAVLRTLDIRAERVYRLLGADYEFLH